MAIDTAPDLAELERRMRSLIEQMAQGYSPLDYELVSDTIASLQRQIFERQQQRKTHGDLLGV